MLWKTTHQLLAALFGLDMRVINMGYVDMICKRLIEIFTLEDQARKVVNSHQKNLDRAIELMYQKDSKIVKAHVLNLSDYLRMNGDDTQALGYAQSAYYVALKV